MLNDFFYASLLGLTILFIFWIIVVIFIYIRKPPNSKLTARLTLISLTLFFVGFGILLYLASVDSFRQL